MKQKRLKAMGVFFLIGAVFLIAALSDICFVDGTAYKASAVMQRKEDIVIKRQRGGFADRNMIPLVDETVQNFCIDENGVLNTDKGSEVSPIPVRYAKDSVGAHLIGYLDIDGNGVSGLEKVFDSYLKCDDTINVSAVKSANGKLIQTAGISTQKDENSADFIKLTIDTHIQKAAEDVLNNHSVTGSAVILDVDTFDVLAMASYPTFDRNNVQKYVKSNGSELVNRSLCEYNAGSIFKIITLCSALERGKTLDSYTCTGSISAGEHTFNCHKADGHGYLNTKEAFAKSCNCAFYTLGQALGSEAILDAARFFDLGNPAVSYDGFDEARGNIPSKSSYSPLDCINYSIGQGEILITPVQAASVACVIASGGIKKAINIADAVCTCSGEKKINLRKTEEKRVISLYTAQYLKECMRLAVTDGTGQTLASSSAAIAGKTGTAETGWIKDGKNLEHGWFCGFFPYDKPKYAMAVIAEGGGSGSMSAAPVFMDIAEEINRIYPVENFQTVEREQTAK